jgi:predicted DNA-binding transcriptional regulator AlpA
MARFAALAVIPVAGLHPEEYLNAYPGRIRPTKFRRGPQGLGPIFPSTSLSFLMKTNHPKEDEPKALMLSRQEVAQLLGVSEKHVYRLDRKGLMPQSQKLLNRVLYSRKKIEEWIENGCQALAV